MKSVMILIMFMVVIAVVFGSLLIVKVAKNSIRENDIKLVILSSKIGYNCSVDGFELAECQSELLRRIDKKL